MCPSTTAIRRAIPELPSAVFARLVQQLSTDDLRRFPAQRVPPGLPPGFADNLPTAKRTIITDLMLEAEADRLREQFGLGDRYGEAVVDALHSLETAAEPRGLELCRECLDRLETLAASGGDRSAAEQTLTAVLAALYEQYSAVQSAMARLESVAVEDQDRTRFAGALDRARRMLAPVDEIICRFYGLRLGFAARQMSDLRARLAARQTELQRLEARIESLREALAQDQQLFSVLRPGGRGRRQSHEVELTELLQQKRMLQVPVDENQLIAWLDVIVEPSLHQPSELRWAQVLRRLRVQLLQLLNVYCTDQEGAAREAAAMPFAQVDARKVIEFSLRSEAFLLGYFSRKRQQQVCWLKGAASDRLRVIDRLQEDLLRELRRNSKRA